MTLKKFKKEIKYFVANTILMQLAGVARAYTATMMWLWFVVPSLGVAALPFWAAWGIGEVYDVYHTFHTPVEELFNDGPTKPTEGNESLSKSEMLTRKYIGMMLFVYPFALGSSWLIKHFFM